MVNKTRVFIAIILISVLCTSVVYAAAEWEVSKSEPAPFGQQVAIGQHSTVMPDVSWVAPVGGKLQAVSWDNDPKCNEMGHVIKIERAGGTDNYPVPTAPLKPGKGCADPVDLLYASRIFDVEGGDTASGETRDDSGKIWFNFKTYTPVPTSMSTNTPTNVPPSTSTNTPIPTNPVENTATPVPISTNTPMDIPTSTSTTEAPGLGTPTPTDMPANTPTATPTSIPTAESTSAAVDTPTNTPMPTSTSIPTPSPTSNVEPPVTPGIPSALEPIIQPKNLYVLYAPWTGK